jgi:menaquinone-dependent protoporphyrinogen oxidase
MKVLVSAASRHGSTAELAAVVADVLRSRGHDAIAVPPADVTSLAGYDAVVLGSGVYYGRWLDPAHKFVDRFAADLAGKQVFMFSSGPVGGTTAIPDAIPTDVAGLMERVGAFHHVIFDGKLDPNSLGLRERMAVKVVGVPQGDFRDWYSVIKWAGEVADELGPWVPRTPQPSGRRYSV